MDMTTLYSAMADHDNACKSAMDNYHVMEKSIEADYGDSKVGQQKITEAKNLRDSAVDAAKKTGMETVERVFSDMAEKLSAAVTAPVSADFLSTLETIKVMGKNLSSTEAEAYLKKYNKYAEYRTLASVFRELGVANLPIISYDKIIEDMERSKALANDFFKNDMGDYMHRLLLADKNPLKTFDTAISLFLSGDIQGYMNAVYSPEQVNGSRQVFSNH